MRDKIKKGLMDYNLDDIDLLEGEIKKTLKELFPITRSITGDGVRKTYKILNKIAKFKIHEIPTGKKCYDWIIPEEWNVKDAYIEDEAGERIIDFKKNNLQVVNYSMPVDKTVDYNELIGYLHTLPQLPKAIPYRTSYYKKNWGFCISYDRFKKLNKKGKFHVFIDAQHKRGSLTLGDYLHAGKSKEEYLISTYSCHPSLANDNLSGMVLWAFLLKIFQSIKTKHSYRFVIWPETIGAISYLSSHEKEMKKNKGGFVITTVAGPDNFGYKKTFLGNSAIDNAVFATFKEFKINPLFYEFSPMGSDERQLSSPAFRIPIGTITKSKYYEYPQYHTSLDNLNFISAKNLVKTLKLYLASLQKLEAAVVLKPNFPFCEPNLGKRGLYPTLGGGIKQGLNKNRDHNKKKYDISKDGSISGKDLDIIKWILFYADGKNSILDIAEKTGFSLGDIGRIADLLKKNGLIDYDL